MLNWTCDLYVKNEYNLLTTVFTCSRCFVSLFFIIVYIFACIMTDSVLSKMVHAIEKMTKN